jgi:hypothetical protein
MEGGVIYTWIRHMPENSCYEIEALIANADSADDARVAIGERFGALTSGERTHMERMLAAFDVMDGDHANNVRAVVAGATSRTNAFSVTMKAFPSARGVDRIVIDRVIRERFPR